MPEDVEIDIFDYRGNVEIVGAKAVLFSEAIRDGYNPLIAEANSAAFAYPSDKNSLSQLSMAAPKFYTSFGY